MTSGKRFRLSAAERAEVWRRWKEGQSLHAIGRALGRAHPVVHFLLKRHGGIAPHPRRRSGRALTLAEREDISRGIASGCSLRIIAQGLRRAPCTVEYPTCPGCLLTATLLSPQGQPLFVLHGYRERR